MKPLISIQLRDGQGPYMPGDELECRYQIDAVELQELQAVEASVLWYSEGKGEEDLAVHAFQRHVPADVDDRDLRRWTTLSTRLPNSPLSYDGVILKIHWCIRVRVFGVQGKEASTELPFRLGKVPSPPRPAAPEVSDNRIARPTLAIAELTSSARMRSSGDENGE